MLIVAVKHRESAAPNGVICVLLGRARRLSEVALARLPSATGRASRPGSGASFVKAGLGVAHRRCLDHAGLLTRGPFRGAFLC